MSKGKIKRADILETVDVLWEQFQEDRALIKDQYMELRAILSGNVERYVVLADPLAKYAELLTKQTAQVLEFVKIIKKDEKEDNSLSDEDIIKISEAINVKQ